jgi:NAD(P)-dependent dehydrogenase (short-subunit alcohol dehydrogenase family)
MLACLFFAQGSRAFFDPPSIRPAEIGAAAAFLASQDSSFMTASELAVDGGLAQI